jgi:hypothetical protein
MSNPGTTGTAHIILHTTRRPGTGFSAMLRAIQPSGIMLSRNAPLISTPTRGLTVWLGKHLEAHHTATIPAGYPGDTRLIIYGTAIRIHRPRLGFWPHCSALKARPASETGIIPQTAQLQAQTITALL